MRKIRKTKIKTKKTVSKAKKSRVRKPKEKIKAYAPPSPKKEIFSSEEVIIERQKFFHPQESSAAAQGARQELPLCYDRDMIALQVRDPRWLYSYWELRHSTVERLKNELKERFHNARLILRVYDVSLIIFDGSNAHSFFDVDINGLCGSWYIEAAPDKSWCVDLGFKLRDGSFLKLLRSNTVHTPSEGPSCITDEEWMVADNDFARLYGMGFGFGKSSPIGKNWQKRIKKMLISRDISSRRVSS